MNSAYPSDIKSISTSVQPHKFFERFLDSDLSKLTKELQDRYEKIERAEVLGVTEVKDNELWQSSNSVSTMKWREYNVFQFHIDGIHELYKNVASMVKEACDYYSIDFDSQKFMVQGWFNINYTKKGKLDWHDHGPFGAPNFHGYYCVKAEPSVTYYKVFDKETVNHNIDNRAVLSEMGHPHAQADWDWEGPRITVAYDIIPLKDLQKFGMHQEQHWIPLV
jgi:hypothetical protein